MDGAKEKYFNKKDNLWYYPIDELDKLKSYVKDLAKVEEREDHPMRVIELFKDGDECIVKFKYNQEIVDIVKSIEKRRYDPETKTWKIPINRVKEFMNKFEKSNDICFEYDNREQYWIK